MPKSKTTVPQGYSHGYKQISAFIKGEIGTVKEVNEKLAKLQKEVESSKSSDKKLKGIKRLERKEYYEKQKKALKVEHHQQYKKFREYGDKLYEWFGYEEEAKKNNEKATIGSDVLEQLLSLNKFTRNNPLFTSAKLSWKSTSGKNAVNKFVNLLLNNDAKKFEYYKKMLKETNTPLQLSEVLDAPIAVSKTAEQTDIEDLARKMRELEEKLNMTEGFHANSSEYKAMKSALKAVNQGLKEGIEPAELGSRFEALQAASMDYVQAKGVGTQATPRGKQRMDAALDICSVAVDGMDYYASKERRKEVESFEQKHFKRVLSVDKMNDNYIDGLTDIYKESLNVKIETEDDLVMEYEEEYL